jgi:hypothetical protein
VVKIERGIWWNGGVAGSTDKAFESMEGDAWATKYPGLPAYVMANAVRVSIRRPHLHFNSALFSGGSFSLERVAVAIKGSTETVNVAPFAIPVCDLLDGKLEYYGQDTPTNLCRGDRYFVRADRYQNLRTDNSTWPGAYPLDSIGVPSFPWQPCNENFTPQLWQYYESGMAYFETSSDLQTYVGQYGWQYGDSYALPITSEDGISCAEIHGANQFFPPAGIDPTFSASFAGKQTFPRGDDEPSQRTDNFGVVGLPNFSGTDLEATIRNTLQSPNDHNPLWPASIGDPFKVLPNGLSDVYFDSAIWDTISNGGTAIADDAHLPLKETPMKTIDRTFSAFSSFAGIVYNGSVISDYWFYDTNLDSAIAANGAVWALEAGVAPAESLCNSKWASFGNFGVDSKILTNGTNGSHYINAYYAHADVLHNASVSDDTPVWKVMLPVIADPSSPVTCRTDSGALDLPVNPSKTYMIIGFVQGYIYDVDIGQPQPKAIFTTADGAVQSFADWGFHADEIPACNMVRGRLDCEKFFIPSSDPSASTNSKIVF